MEYSELRSLIIALLAFCVPIVAAIADKRAKARKRSPQVNAEPIDFERLERERHFDELNDRSGPRACRGAVPEPAVPEPVEGPRGTSAARSFTVPEPAVAELSRSIEGQVAEGAALRLSQTVAAPKQAKEAQSGQYPTAEEIKKDCKKLILYSEILKPKYDNFD